MADTRNTETTPLISSSPASNAGSNFYFLQRSNSNISLATKGELSAPLEADAVVEIMPAGASEAEFASRPILSNGRSELKSKKSTSKRGLFQSLFGLSSTKNNDNSYVTVMKQRQAGAIKVEPKVFFANERTFLAWLHTSVLLAGASVAILSFADGGFLSQLYGLLLLPVAISFISYAMHLYAKRSSMIRKGAPGPYEDLIGPTVLGVLLMVSIVAQFAIKLYTIF